MIAAVTRDAEFLYISTTYGWAKIWCRSARRGADPLQCIRRTSEP